MGVQIFSKDVSVISSIINKAKANISNVVGVVGWSGGGGPASQGPNYGSAASSDNSVGSLVWSNPSYANSATDGNLSASVSATDMPFETQYLKLSGYGFSIPSGATINGITVNIRRQRSTNFTTDGWDVKLYLLKGGVVSGNNKAATTTLWPSSVTGFQVATYGGASDLWGGTWTPSDINSSSFGIVLSASTAAVKGKGGLRVEYINIKIDYTT